MNYLYHRVRENMRGTVLYPLNRLKEVYPDIYSEAVKKYEGREFVMDYSIPTLNCKWNDALHLTAVHPKEVYDALRDAGFQPSKKRFYKIDPNILDVENSTVYLYKYKRSTKIDNKNFVPFNPDQLSQYETLPEYTKEYFKKMKEEGKRPLIYHGVPHILYKGTLDISNCEIIEV